MPANLLRPWLDAGICRAIAARLGDEWISAARAGQYPAGGVAANWILLGGRGAGKTRLGAEWVNAHVRGVPPFVPVGMPRYGRIALVGETLGDVREVMIDGPSGIMSIRQAPRPRYEASRRRLLWDDGRVATAFSSEDPESLRGPQFDAAWCDEVGKWKHARDCFDMLQFGLRLGAEPHLLITTTPRPTALLRALVRALTEPA